MSRLHLFTLTSLLTVTVGAGCRGEAPTSPDVATVAEPAPSPATGGAAAPEVPPSPVLSTPVPMMDVAVTSFGADTLDGQLYILGGYHGEPHDYDRTGQTGRFARLDPASGEWTELPGTEPLQSVTLVTAGGRVVRAGGMRAHNDPGQKADLRSVDEVAAFDPATGAWTDLAPLPTPRSSHGAATVGGRVYIVGGWTLSGTPGEGEFASETLVMDGASWKAISQPFQRRALAVVAVGDLVYAIGGLDDNGKPSSRVDVLDTRSGQWRQAPGFPAMGFGLGAAVVGDRVVASGMDGVVYTLDPAAKAWKPAANLAFPRFFHELVPAEDGASVYAVGGIHGMTTEDRVHAVERVPLDHREAEALVWELGDPGPAKNRQGMFLRGDSLYLFGGNNSVGQHDFEPENFVDAGRKLMLTSMRWSEIAPYPARRQTMQTLVLDDGHGLSVGGFGHDGEVAITHPESFVYDFGADAWTPRPGTLPISRSQFGLTRYEDELWVFGGLDYDPRRKGKDQFRHLLPVLVADANDPQAGFEPAGVDLEEPRRAFAGAVHDGKYYLVGGMREGFNLVDECHVFDFEKKKWSKIPSPPGGTRLGAELIPIDGKLYLVGGSVFVEGDKGPVSELTVEVYDPKSKEWSVALEELPFDPRHARTFAYGKNLLMFSTHDGERDVARVAIIRLPAVSSQG